MVITQILGEKNTIIEAKENKILQKTLLRIFSTIASKNVYFTSNNA